VNLARREPVGDRDATRPHEGAATDPTAPPAGSLAARLRAHRRALEDGRTETFALPEYAGELAIRYRRLGHEETQQVLFDPDIPTVLERNAQFLIDACEEVHGLEDGQPVTLGPGGRAVRFDRDLAAVLGFDAGTARDVVLQLFDGDENAVIEHSDEVYTWMKRRHEAAEKALVEGH
jgi:hypothetical protein